MQQFSLYFAFYFQGFATAEKQSFNKIAFPHHMYQVSKNLCCITEYPAFSVAQCNLTATGNARYLCKKGEDYVRVQRNY